MIINVISLWKWPNKNILLGGSSDLGSVVYIPNYKCISLTYPTYNWCDVTHLLSGMSHQGQYLPHKQMGLSETWSTQKETQKHMGFLVRHQTIHDNSGSQTCCETTKWLTIMCTMRETTLTMA